MQTTGMSTNIEAEAESSRRPSYTTLSPSPSASSLTSSSSFDPHVAPPVEAASKPQVLGLSEIAKMIKRDRDRRKGKKLDPVKHIQIMNPDYNAGKEVESDEEDGLGEEDEMVEVPTTAETIRSTSSSTGIMPDSSTIGIGAGTGAGSSSDVFTADVSIRGWKIVGGKDWGDNARVGAYVGKLTPSYHLGDLFGSSCLVYDILITKRRVS